MESLLVKDEAEWRQAALRYQGDMHDVLGEESLLFVNGNLSRNCFQHW